jgi:uncharacterized membrane protein YjjB (DUF3815 family)
VTAGLGEVAANAAGALAAALVSTLLVRRNHVPGFVLVSAALLPLVPGLSLYNGLLEMVGTSAQNANPATGASTLFLALGLAPGIAAEASLGTYFGRPLADQLRRIHARPRHRSPTGRLTP